MNDEKLMALYEEMSTPLNTTEPLHQGPKEEVFKLLERMDILLKSKQAITNGGYWATVASKLDRVIAEIENLG